jgi:hypothetical protein
VPGGGATYVRRTNGTRVIGGGGTSYVEPGAVVASADPGAAAEPAAAAGGEPEPGWGGSYPVSTRGGRWFRRGRHIVLTGV